MMFFLLLIITLISLILHIDGASYAEMMEDDRVFMVEFYSGMCGSCQEFSPTWNKLEKAAKSIATAKVNIDEPEGMEFAQKLGVLDEGLPNIRLFTSTAPDHKGQSVLPGMPEPYKKIMSKVKGFLSSGLTKRDDGMFVKSS